MKYIKITAMENSELTPYNSSLVKITYIDTGEVEMKRFSNDRPIEWYMDQYQRNRGPLKWKIQYQIINPNK
jgi:hypothetical protein